MAAITTEAPATSGFAGYGSKGYRGFVLGMLLLVYTFNFIDRVAIDILQEDIKKEFGLVDFQLGLLKGLAFAFLYTLLGIPIARLAERANRVTILSVCLGLWSVFTAACGMAGSFLQLIAARIGVGIGEAGCTPPAQSVIADYFPANKRATALSIYSMGIHIGSMSAAIIGALIAQEWGWRATFIALGLPGIILAILVRLAVREPPRAASAVATPGFGETLRVLASKPAFWHMAMGGAITSFVGYGVGGFLIPFFMRVHELTRLEASLTNGIILGTFAAFGTFLSGFLADRWAKRHPNALAWLPAAGLLFALPLFLLAYQMPTMQLTIGLIALGVVGQYFYLGPMYTVTSSVVAPNMRATAVAILLFIVNMIGYALGPPFVGWVSDIMANRALAPSGLDVESCRRPLDAQAAVCAAGQAEGLQYAMMIGVLFFLWAAAHFFLCARTLRRDTVS
jgi:MFS family permease